MGKFSLSFLLFFVYQSAALGTTVSCSDSRYMLPLVKAIETGPIYGDVTKDDFVVTGVFEIREVKTETVGPKKHIRTQQIKGKFKKVYHSNRQSRIPDEIVLVGYPDFGMGGIAIPLPQIPGGTKEMIASVFLIEGKTGSYAGMITPCTAYITKPIVDGKIKYLNEPYKPWKTISFEDFDKKITESYRRNQQ